MIGYLIVMAMNVFAYMWLRSLPNPDHADKIPKYRKLQLHSHALLTCFGMIGVISSRIIFGIASEMMQLIMCIVMAVLLCVAAVFQVWAWRWFRMSSDNNDLKNKVYQLESENQDLRDEIENLCSEQRKEDSN